MKHLTFCELEERHAVDLGSSYKKYCILDVENILKVFKPKVRLSVENLCANAFCVLIKSARRHGRKRAHTHVRNCVCIYACKQMQTRADTSTCAYICMRVHTLDRIYVHAIRANERSNDAYMYIGAWKLQKTRQSKLK